eukprot:3334693-Amphidinium_carterae.1
MRSTVLRVELKRCSATCLSITYTNKVSNTNTFSNHITDVCPSTECANHGTTHLQNGISDVAVLAQTIFAEGYPGYKCHAPGDMCLDSVPTRITPQRTHKPTQVRYTCFNLASTAWSFVVMIAGKSRAPTSSNMRMGMKAMTRCLGVAQQAPRCENTLAMTVWRLLLKTSRAEEYMSTWDGLPLIMPKLWNDSLGWAATGSHFWNDNLDATDAKFQE